MIHETNDANEPTDPPASPVPTRRGLSPQLGAPSPMRPAPTMLVAEEGDDADLEEMELDERTEPLLTLAGMDGLASGASTDGAQVQDIENRARHADEAAAPEGFGSDRADLHSGAGFLIEATQSRSFRVPPPTAPADEEAADGSLGIRGGWPRSAPPSTRGAQTTSK